MELTPQLLETQQFPEKWRGYDQDAVDEFLDGVFTPKIDLTQHDISSLDGSAMRGRADRVLKEILGK